MTDSWRTATIDSVCLKVTSGGTPSRKVPEYFVLPTDGGTPWLKTKELNDAVVQHTEEHITEEAIRGSSAKVLPAGTVAMAMYGATVGKLGILGRPMTCNQAVCAMVVDPAKADNRFLYYNLLYNRDSIINLAVGSAQQNLSGQVIKNLQLPFPNVAEQRRIAGVLGALDDLIEVNRRLIRDLDDLGLLSLLAALPRGSAEVDGSDETDGWEYTTLADASSVLETGSRPKGGVAAIRRGVPSVGAESIDGLARFNFSKVKFVSEEFFAGMKRGHVASGDVLVYKDGGTPGSFTPKVGMFGEGFPFGRMSINEHVFRVRVNSPISNAYLYFWLRTERMMSEMHRAGTGAAIPGINKTAFGCLPIVIPPAETAQPLCASLENICTAALQIANEIRQLEETRDELLPLLMSGRVRVAEEVAA